MKSFIAPTLAIITLVSSTIAAPIESSAVDTIGNVLLCTHVNWVDCELTPYDITDNFPVWPCLALPSRFDGNLGSIEPDKGILCRIWTDSSCSEAANTLITAYPGISNLYDNNGTDTGHSAHFIGCIPCSNCT